MVFLTLVGKATKIAVLMLLLLTVVVVFVSPLVDLEPTVLRHLQASVLLFFALVLVCGLTANQAGSCCYCLVPDNSASLRKDSLSRIHLTCVRLC